MTQCTNIGSNSDLHHTHLKFDIIDLFRFFLNFKTGEELFRKLLMDEEKLNIDMVYEVIDWHTKAVLKTREITEVEMEAIALSRIGKVYDKVLKLKYKAKEYLLRAMQLANSMHPRNFHGEGIQSSLI